MSEPHATNGAGQSRSHETVTTVSLSSAPWVADGISKASKATYYRRRQANKNEIQELNKQINLEPKLEAGITEPEIKSENTELKAEPNVADEATRALKARIAEAEQSQRLQREYQQQVDQANQQINQVFNFWQQNGLSPEQEQIFRADPAFMIRLTDFAVTEAGKLHQVGSPEFFELGKQLFFQHLDHLQDQAKQHAAAAPPTAPMPATDNQTNSEPAMETPRFQTPASPVRKPQAPSRSGIVSAPVTRETGLLSDSFDRKGQHTLSAQEAEAARISGVTPAEYLKQKLKMQQMKADGEIV